MKRMIPCNDCPFRRTTQRGYTTCDPARQGTLDACDGLLTTIAIQHPQTCHKHLGKIREHFSDFPCRGVQQFFRNQKAPGTHPKIFDNVSQFLEHHVTKPKNFCADEHQRAGGAL